MQRDCALRIAGRGHLTSFSVKYKTGKQSLFECAESLTKEELSPRQTSRREDHHIVRNARVQPSASSAAIQAQVAPSLGAPVSCRTIRRRLAEGHLVSRCLLRVLPLTPNHQHLPLEWCHARRNWTAAEWNKVVFSEGNPDSISAVMTIVFVCGDPGVNASILLYFTAILRSHSWCDVMGCHCLQYTVTSSINPWHHDSPVVCP
ncbi:UNVERIFIED_CONTAM: hypothetical protein NCL1_32619 [Trichonephila clavipes]